MSRGINVVNGAVQQAKDEPTYDESIRFQAKLIGIWEQQQQVLGYTKANSHLFIRRNRGDYLPDKAVAKTFVRSAVQSFSGFGPQTLRITCLQEMAALNGPNFLREANGISGTHAGRYGSYEEYLVEEAFKRYWSKLNNQKQH